MIFVNFSTHSEIKPRQFPLAATWTVKKKFHYATSRSSHYRLSVGRHAISLSHVGTCDKSWCDWFSCNTIMMFYLIYRFLIREFFNKIQGRGSKMLLGWGTPFWAWRETPLSFLFFLSKKDSRYHNVTCWKCLTWHLSLSNRTANKWPGTNATYKKKILWL